MDQIYFQSKFSDITNLILVVAMLAALVWRWKREDLPKPKAIWLFTLRLTVFVMALIALQNPMIWDAKVERKQKQVVLVVDDSMSMKVKNGGNTRWNKVMQAANEIANSDLNEKYVLPLVTLSKPWDTHIEDFGTTPNKTLEGLAPKVDESALQTVTRTQLKRFDRRQLAGIILLSDGRSTEEDVKKWLHIEKARVPVHALVPTGAQDQDSRISTLVGNDFCRKGDRVTLTAFIEHQGPPKNTRVALYQGDQLIEHKSITLNKKVHTVDFKVVMNDIGWHEMRVKLSHQDPVMENNERSLMLRVLEDNLKVLLVSGLPHYDFRYLREALERDKTVKLSVLLQSADKEHPGWANSITEFPKTLKDLLKYDVVILQDVDSRDIDEYSWIALSRFVEEAQGALLIQAGYQYNFPYQAMNTPFAKLFPQKAIYGAEKQGPFKPVVENDLFSSILPKKMSDWPEFHWAAKVDSVPTLTQVVWSHPTAKTNDGKPLPLVSWTRQGRGKVGYFGLANMWRFRAKGGDPAHFGLYSAFVRFLADNRYSGQSKLLRFKVGTEGSVVAGQSEIMRVEIHDATYNPYEAKDVSCTLITPSGLKKKRVLPSVGEGAYQIRNIFTEHGVYKVLFDIEGEKKEYRFVVHHSNREFDDIRLGTSLLLDVAERTQGQYVRLENSGKHKDDLEEFITYLNQQPDSANVKQSRMLWNATWYGVLMFALLLIEWVCRRVWSLP